MSNVIQFLERMGSNADFDRGYLTSVTALDVADAQRRALLDRDHAGLSRLLEGRAEMRCFIATPIGEDWLGEAGEAEMVELRSEHNI